MPLAKNRTFFYTFTIENFKNVCTYIYELYHIIKQ